MQVEGTEEIHRIVTGVTASQALIDAAVERGADALLVHRGYFWRGENPVICGMKRARLGLLLKHNINLLAYHLPLDAHPDYGNNIGLARALGFSNAEPVEDFAEPGLLWRSTLEEPLSAQTLLERLRTKLARVPTYISGGDQFISSVAWCTGGAQQYIDAAADCGADAFITGEVSEQTAHTARERGIHFYAAGHHATERYGAKAMAEHLPLKFSVQAEFVDIDNPA